MVSDQYYTVAEAAKLTNIPKRTIYAAMERGELTHYNIGSIRLKLSDLDLWIESKRIDPHPIKNEKQPKRPAYVFKKIGHLIT